MFQWAKENPHSALASFLSLIAGVYWTVRFLLARHREFVAFSDHMKREETEVWPSVQQQQQAMNAQMAANHLEGMTMLKEHGARITALEDRMPDGQLRRIEEMLDQLLRRQ